MERRGKKRLDPVLELGVRWTCGWILMGVLEFLGSFTLGLLPAVLGFLAGLSDARFRLHWIPSFCPGGLRPLSVSSLPGEKDAIEDIFKDGDFCCLALCLCWGLFLDRYLHIEMKHAFFIRLFARQTQV